MIESVKNDKVKFWAKLGEKKYREETGKFLVEGEHLVEEAKKAGLLEEVIVMDENRFDYENTTIVSEAVMKKITTLANVPRIIGVAKKPEPRGISGNVLLLDGIQDPGNMGTIIRSAAAFGIDTIVAGEGTVSVYNSKVVRATEGLLFHVNVISADLTLLIPELKKEGYIVYSSKVDGGQKLSDTSFAKRVAIVVGSEGSGVRDEVSDMCDEFLYIPMSDKCESLNVGVATSIILYELNR